MDTTVKICIVLEVFAVISFLAAVYLQFKNEILGIFSKVSEEEVVDFFKTVCKFYGLEMAEDPSHADDTRIALVIKEGLISKHEAYGMFSYRENAVILDAGMCRYYAGKRVYMTILHELTHAWCYSVAPDVAMELSYLTKAGHLYWDSSNPIEETARVAEHKGLDIREAWLTLVSSEPVLQAVKNGTNGYMGITFAVLKAAKTPLPAEILAKIR